MSEEPAHAAAPTEPSVSALSRAILETAHEAFGVRATPARWLFDRALGPSARAAARRGAAFDRAVAVGSAPSDAAIATLRPFAASVTIEGAAHAPRFGPLLAVCNHAGLGDGLAAMAAIDRPDLAVMARRRGLLKALPEFSRRVIEVPDARPDAALRRALKHLRAGGALLMFAAGEIEPDPRLDLGGAKASLSTWSPSVDWLAARADGAATLPIAVGGVVSRRASAAPPARWISDARDRSFAAATLQLLTPWFRDASVRVAVGAPILGAPALARARAQMTMLLARVADAE